MNPNHSRLLPLLLALLVGVMVASGCMRTTGVARGWSGATVDDGILFFGSTKGEIVAVDVSNGNLNQLGATVKIEMASSGGGLACIPTTCGGPRTTAVAIYGAPVVRDKEDEKLVFIGGYDGKVRAFLFQGNSLRNEPRWIYPREGTIGAPIVGGLVVAQDKLYFASSNGKVYALNAADGFKEWEFEAGDKIWSTPVIDGETLYIGCFDRSLYALNTTDGTEKWHFETGGAIATTPVVYDNRVYFGSFDRYFYAVNAISGQKIWRFPASDEAEDMPSNWFWAKPLLHSGIIYAPCLDGKVYAFDAESGDKIIEFDLGSPISSSPVLVGSLVVAATQKGNVYTLDTANNQQKQLAILEEDEKVYAPLFAHQGTVYVHAASDKLYAIDVESGASKKFTLTD